VAGQHPRASGRRASPAEDEESLMAPAKVLCMVLVFAGIAGLKALGQQ
jgi:hypothetical protein